MVTGTPIMICITLAPLRSAPQENTGDQDSDGVQVAHQRHGNDIVSGIGEKFWTMRC